MWYLAIRLEVVSIDVMVRLSPSGPAHTEEFVLQFLVQFPEVLNRKPHICLGIIILLGSLVIRGFSTDKYANESCM